MCHTPPPATGGEDTMDNRPTSLTESLDRGFLEQLLTDLDATLPPAATDAAGRARRSAMRLTLLSLAPRTPMEALLATEAIAAHHVIMGCYRIALAPEAEPAAAAEPPARRNNPMQREGPAQPTAARQSAEALA
jgi:hypothetical protein